MSSEMPLPVEMRRILKAHPNIPFSSKYSNRRVIKIFQRKFHPSQLTFEYDNWAVTARTKESTSSEPQKKQAKRPLPSSNSTTTTTSQTNTKPAISTALPTATKKPIITKDKNDGGQPPAPKRAKLTTTTSKTPATAAAFKKQNPKLPSSAPRFITTTAVQHQEPKEGSTSLLSGASPASGTVSSNLTTKKKTPSTTATSLISSIPSNHHRHHDDDSSDSSGSSNMMYKNKVGAISQSTSSKNKNTKKKERKSTTNLKHSFDLSTLRAVRRKTRPPLRPKKVIELIDKKTKEALVCFRGATDVCRALQLERKMVTGACVAFGTPRQLHYDAMFKTFALRYMQSGTLPTVYEYGAHPEDFKANVHNETHEERYERFKDVNELEQRKLQRKRGEGLADVGEGVSNGGPVVAAAAATTAATLRDLTAGASIRDQVKLSEFGGKPKSEGAFPNHHHHTQQQQPEDEVQTLCIFCQEKPARIVFEPCQHCVMCMDCSEEGAKKFCPLCRTPIVTRVEPTYVRLVRPRIYSAYSFM